jgi:hypothetical protein
MYSILRYARSPLDTHFGKDARSPAYFHNMRNLGVKLVVSEEFRPVGGEDFSSDRGLKSVQVTTLPLPPIPPIFLLNIYCFPESVRFASCHPRKCVTASRKSSDTIFCKRNLNVSFAVFVNICRKHLMAIFKGSGTLAAASPYPALIRCRPHYPAHV